MNTYHKIQTVYKRDPETKFKTLLEGEYSLEEFEYLKNNVWVFTEKVDGTNIRIIYNGAEIFFKGKTDKAVIPVFLMEKLHEQFTPLTPLLKEKFGEEPIEVCLYGEGYGAKIQKVGSHYRQDQGFVLFDVKIGRWWLKREDVEDIARFLNIEVVPIIGEGTLNDMVEMAREGFHSRWGDFMAEGIVARPKVELAARNGARIITKIKHKDFVSKNEL